MGFYLSNLLRPIWKGYYRKAAEQGNITVAFLWAAEFIAELDELGRPYEDIKPFLIYPEWYMRKKEQLEQDALK